MPPSAAPDPMTRSDRRAFRCCALPRHGVTHLMYDPSCSLAAGQQRAGLSDVRAKEWAKHTAHGPELTTALSQPSQEGAGLRGQEQSPGGDSREPSERTGRPPQPTLWSPSQEALTHAPWLEAGGKGCPIVPPGSGVQCWSCVGGCWP